MYAAVRIHCVNGEFIQATCFLKNVIKTILIMLGWKTKAFNMPVRRALNVLDVLGDIDLIYSSDTDKMLRNYGVDKLVSERDFVYSLLNFSEFW